MKNAKIVAFLLLILSGFAFAGQEFLLGPGGKHIPLKSDDEIAIKEALKVRELKAAEEMPQMLSTRDEYPVAWADDGTWYTFGYGTGDSMAQYMVPLTDATLKRVFIRHIDFCGTAEILIHDATYAGEVTSGSCADANGWVGLYENGVWTAGTNECFNSPPLGTEIWPGLGIGGYAVTLDETNAQQWQELDLGVLGYKDVSGPFMIDALMTKTDESCWGIGAWDELELPYHGFKYYLNAGTSGNPGWHIRSFGWDVYAMVEYLNDIPPFIEDVTKLYTTLSQDPRTVSATITDVNPTGGAYGVAEALLNYSFNGGDTVSVTMTSVVDTFSAEIPGGVPGDEITYFVSATDVNGNSIASGSVTYTIFEPVEPNLFINNSSLSNAAAEYYYLYSAPEDFAYDLWDGANYGSATLELLQNYETVAEVSGGGPNSCADSTDMAAWLDGGNVNYIHAGDEYLGACFYGWSGEVDLESGFFAYDYLGLDYYYPDINYLASGDSHKASRLIPVEGDVISGDLAAFLADSLVLNYDPYYEIGESNWLDAVEAVEGASIAYYGVSGVLDSLGVPTGTDTLPTAVYMEHTNGNRTAFFGFDALSLNTSPSYYWISKYFVEAPLPMALVWTGYGVGIVDNEVSMPSSFKLHQNYPNPFNPVTTIAYDLPRDGHVTLTVYNMLGQKVATLVNEFGRAGNHTVNWNGTDDLGHVVSTGVYLYKIDAGDFSATKKMILMK